ncbi:UDP-2,3-diacylglucosamine diphosphatase [Candidatus Endoriftia persephone]|jgi:UDP-2,3-diacylglucosamine hydrolase|uniref:UDP-2,3-diacylglucosamine hydrolase n=3 Tax=Gammaproteobacteria TaxID=1236 RepID=G2FBD5_9GAMM|nr:UDP-2,3-diacylglucosamine diphosphatase [Candidatus Endoriftia persephone]EGV52566.1 UDP-2,3-diacylglucosamine hydrolase [endosymbiont of Riftia pachyptila (vent Ph05)]EGW56073.1 UDP-2,3-diacylglucosamine hydrolase [endosymbiont of Tevnia jerichonana (vent Tica)]USF88192.1 UDP-2,3-diacylglucosamine diphosphatase [Candidatus Endoriftia persephone]
MAETLFISDLHLSAERPETVHRFLRFLASEAQGAEALYILGDLFDAWIGDDLVTPEINGIIHGMRLLAESGTKIFLMHGNRDFLLGEIFCNASGATLISDPTLIELYGTPTLLMHGDLLCSDDTAYQAFRQQVREPTFIKQFLSQPIPERIAAAQEYRTKSGEAISLKAEAIMDVNQQTLESYLREQQCGRLIHGHTHRPGLHDFELDGQPVQRYVLGEWDSGGAEILSASAQGVELKRLPA